jgi:HIV Tat-specific factor 1
VDEDTFGPSITEDDVQISVNTNSRVVVLKHMFTLREIEEDPTLLLDLKEDVREECETLGEVTNVVLYDVWLALFFCVICLLSNRFPYRKNQMASSR